MSAIVPWRSHVGRAAPLCRTAVDTDQILPAEFVKRITREGYADGLFARWRQEDPDFVLNRPEYAQATILIAGADFGIGSSREHAVWALRDAGFQTIISPSFGDIFEDNAYRCGLLPITLSETVVAKLQQLVLAQPNASVVVDLADSTVTMAGQVFRFVIDPFRRDCLMDGIDEVEATLRHHGEITRFEARRAGFLPRMGTAL